MDMKRTMAPKFWPIERKTKKYTICPEPGPHPKDKSISLGILLRDLLHHAQTLKEVKTLLNSGLIKIDGRTRKSKNYPVGVMDVMTIGEESYRVLPTKRGFHLQTIDGNETGIKPEKIIGKTTLKKGKLQLNLFDGRNLIVDKGDYNTGDTIILDLQTNAIKQVIEMKQGSVVLVIGGKNVSKVGKIEEITVMKMHPAQVAIDAGGEKIIVPKDYLFVVGYKEPAIKIGDN